MGRSIVPTADLGCGANPRLHIGVDVQKGLKPLWRSDPDLRTHPFIIADLRWLPFRDNSLDELVSIHSIEHFGWRDTDFLLREWSRVLKPNGRITISCPNMPQIAAIYQHIGDTDPKLGFEAQYRIYGGQGHHLEYHKTGFNYAYLKQCLEKGGFTGVERLIVHEVGCYYHPDNLVVRATKTEVIK